MKREGIFSFLLIFVLPLAIFCFSGCKNQQKNKAETVIVLGTVCTINAFEDASPALYKEVASLLFSLDSVFNANDSSSEISYVNEKAAAAPVSISADFEAVLSKALFFAEKTGGAFDPSIGPLVKLWDILAEDAHVPPKEDIDAARALVDWKKIRLDTTAHTVFFEKTGMALDLGGIAKGYAADQIASILALHKIHRAIIDLGGNIYVFGAKKDGSPWRVGIKDPQNEGGSPALVLEATGMTTVVTSGIYERYFIQDNIRYHHILDPHTGYPAQRNYESVTIVSGSSMQADALSTAVFLLGEDFLSQTELFADTSVIFISSKDGVRASSALEKTLFPLTFSSIAYF